MHTTASNPSFTGSSVYFVSVLCHNKRLFSWTWTNNWNWAISTKCTQTACHGRIDITFPTNITQSQKSYLPDKPKPNWVKNPSVVFTSLVPHTTETKSKERELQLDTLAQQHESVNTSRYWLLAPTRSWGHLHWPQKWTEGPWLKAVLDIARDANSLPNTGLATMNNTSPGRLAKTVTKTKSHLFTTWQTNKPRDNVLGQGKQLYIKKPSNWEAGKLMSPPKTPTFPVHVGRSFWRGREVEGTRSEPQLPLRLEQSFGCL